MKKLLLSMLGMLWMATRALALDFQYEHKGQTLTYTVLSEAEATVAVSNHCQVAGELEIPAVVANGSKEYTVTSIGPSSFFACSELASVKIPATVTSVEASAFYECNGLVKAEFASLVQLCDIDFANPTSNPSYWAKELWIAGKEVREVVIPSSITAIGSGAFAGCAGLTSVAIPGTVTSIGKDAFLDCDGLVKAEFASIEQLCELNFGSSTSNPMLSAKELWIGGEEVREIVIPSTITSIAGHSFAGCSGLNTVVIPTEVTAIGDGAFEGCAGLTSIELPVTVTSIGDKVFAGCAGLTTLVIPESVSTIGFRAFSGCSGLTSVAIPGSVTSIGDYAFANCAGLTSVYLPDNLVTIGSAAFSDCTNLASVYYGADRITDGIANTFSRETYENAMLYVSQKGEFHARTTTPWCRFKNIEPLDFSGIENATSEENAPVEVYNPGGVKLGTAPDNLPAGFYILNQGNATRKILVK